MTRESEILAAKTRLHDRIAAGLIAIRQTLWERGQLRRAQKHCKRSAMPFA